MPAHSSQSHPSLSSGCWLPAAAGPRPGAAWASGREEWRGESANTAASAGGSGCSGELQGYRRGWVGVGGRPGRARRQGATGRGREGWLSRQTCQQRPKPMRLPASGAGTLQQDCPRGHQRHAWRSTAQHCTAQHCTAQRTSTWGWQLPGLQAAAVAAACVATAACAASARAAASRPTWHGGTGRRAWWGSLRGGRAEHAKRGALQAQELPATQHMCIMPG